MQIKIKALDTLFFKDGKPFSRGAETWADGIFPPSPSVFYGALRTLYFSHYPNTLETINEHDPTSKLEINNIMFVYGTEKFIPIPADIVKYEESNHPNQPERLTLLKPTAKQISSSSYPLNVYLSSDFDRVESLDRKSLLSEHQFKSFYFGGNCPKEKIDIENFVASEPKVGIGRNNYTHSTQEGLLYRVDMKRLKNKDGQEINFLVDFSFPELEEVLPKSGLIKLGAENKSTYFEQIDSSTEAQKEDATSNFKITLVTPGIFEKGWLPSFINKDNYTGSFMGKKVELIAAAVGRPMNIGGFDMRAKVPKPLYKAVPAGAVYFLKVLDGEINIGLKPIKLDCIGEKSMEGFGVGLLSKH